MYLIWKNKVASRQMEASSFEGGMHAETGAQGAPR